MYVVPEWTLEQCLLTKRTNFQLYIYVSFQNFPFCFACFFNCIFFSPFLFFSFFSPNQKLPWLFAEMPSVCAGCTQVLQSLKPVKIVLLPIAVLGRQCSTCAAGVISLAWQALYSLPFKWLSQWLFCVYNLAMGNTSSQQCGTRKIPRTI